MTASEPLAVVVGGGPSGLMAADILSSANVKVILAEAKPSVGRKFLMAGKSGLNITKDEPREAFNKRYWEAADRLAPMLDRFGSVDVMRFAESLGQTVFTGSSGRVFPTVMKASPMLRAWLRRLRSQRVDIRTGWRWRDVQDTRLDFDTPHGPQSLDASVTILALGGASWSRLGSDGTWSDLLRCKGIDLAPFEPANMGLNVNWSDRMAPYFGRPIKRVGLCAGDSEHLGEFVISQTGLEGSGIYEVSRNVRHGISLVLDLLPDLSETSVAAKLAASRKRDSMSNRLRKGLGLNDAKRALLFEFGRPLPSDDMAVAQRVKHLPIAHAGPRPLEEAISVAGGVRWDAVDGGLMLRKLPGVFCAGEMLDWEAPTGGYLITACLATGRWAGAHALERLSQGA